MEKVARKLIKTKLNERQGITLIALMITIIVLLILVGVTLSLTIRRKRYYKAGTKKFYRI